ncbi:hypothetical protein BH10BAC1_BH10BAC1_00950 [soil metagenome]
MSNFPEFIQSPIAPQIIHNELEANFLYYKNLTPELKQRFIQRVSFFLQVKKFVARQELQMSSKIRIITSACAVQVTFGLDSYTLDNFEYVVVYPDIYESPMTKKMHKGETNLNGFICLSWKHIIEGIENPDDNYNLGIHEWMHALRFNGINFQATDYFFDGYINKWVSGAMTEYNKLRTGKKSIFRRYGATNIHEFLSVVTEHFFESPDEFKKEAPAFFDEMCILLNQEPSKNESAKIGVRYTLLNVIPKVENNATPLLSLEASFWRTIANSGFGILYLVVAILILSSMQNLFGTGMILLTILGAIIKMNSLYFTIQFYEDYIHLQSGFFSSFSSRLSVTYRCIVKMEIFDGTFNNYSSGTVFQLNYYSGNRFLKKVAHCSAIDVPQQKIKELLNLKKVAILWPN